MAYYRRLRARFEAFALFDPADALELHALLQRGDAAAAQTAAAAGARAPAAPPPWPRGVPDPAAGGTDAARWAGLARSLLGARDDLSLVARLSRAQRARLLAAGVATRTALAALPAPRETPRRPRTTIVGARWQSRGSPRPRSRGCSAGHAPTRARASVARRARRGRAATPASVRARARRVRRGRARRVAATERG